MTTWKPHSLLAGLRFRLVAAQQYPLEDDSDATNYDVVMVMANEVMCPTIILAGVGVGADDSRAADAAGTAAGGEEEDDDKADDGDDDDGDKDYGASGDQAYVPWPTRGIWSWQPR